jgi:monoamine oxidase
MAAAMSDELDVVTVGAGFAGLSAARRLSERGLRVCVLEARDRVGGRVYTRTIDGGSWVDLGGQWVGPTQDHILDLARELGVKTFSTFTTGENQVFYDGKSKRYRGTIPRLDLLSLVNVGWAQWRLETMAKSVPIDAPWDAPNAKEWDARTLESWIEGNIFGQTARRLFSAGLETVYAAHARELSLLHALFYIHSGKDLDTLFGTEGGAQATRMDGGMQQVAEKLAEKIAGAVELRLSSPVRRIEHGERGVVVHYDGGSVRAARAIVAIPPKLTAALEFDPPLEGARAELVTKMPMGAVIKCTAVYDRPFWRDAGLSGLCVSDEGPVHVAFDNSPPQGTPGMLMGFVEADHARKLGRLEESERRDAATACFARYFGDRALRPIAYADHVWERDPWSGGCYGAFMPPGVWTSLGSAIRTPNGPIHWAGTETAAVWSGYIDGAISSGLRAAAEVVRALGQ